VALVDAERDTGRTTTITGPERPRLLRRLMITCPVTGLATDTGFELPELPSVVRDVQVLIDCLECGQDHSWHIDDAMLDRQLGVLREQSAGPDVLNSGRIISCGGASARGS
jgi:hypothetical protein